MMFYGITARLSYQTMQIGFFRMAPRRSTSAGRDKASTTNKRNSAELEKYFGKDKSPREMKDKIISLLDDWKAKQPPELGKPEKKTDLEK